MERNNNTKPKTHSTYLLKNIGSVHNAKGLSSKHRAATSGPDPMAEELRQMSLDINKKEKPHTEPSRRCLAIDRSGVVGIDRPWDGVAYVGTVESNGQKRNGHQQTRPTSKKSSSLDVERGSNV
jgi:hypothetical protein